MLYPNDIQNILSSLPRVTLAQLPSPVSLMPRLTRALNVAVYLKNDGVCSGRYAGNKVRKLEFLLAEARRLKTRHVVTLGAAGSNHAVATSTYAQQLGLRCTVCMTHQPPAPVVTRNLLRHCYLGTHLEIFDGYSHALTRARQLTQTTDSYLIPLGGSSPHAVPGFIGAAAELADQITAGEIPMPDCVYIACGTMGTAVGLALGFAMLKLPIQVVAVRVTDPAVASPSLFRQLYSDSVDYFSGIDASLARKDFVTDPRLLFCEEFYGSGYGVPTAAAQQAVDTATADNLTLDTTYTGKAMAALLAHARSGQLDGRKVLFWNTLNAIDTPVAPAADGVHLGADFQRYFEA